VTSPQKTGAFKSREFGYELLILKGRKNDEKIKVYRSTDRLCDQTVRDRYPRGRSVTATVTVYGPKGADDIHNLTGYTMGSDPEQFGAISEGMYDGNYDAMGKSGSLKSNWTINRRGRVRTIDGMINPFAPDQIDENGEGYKTGIFVHTSNQSGFAGTYNNGKDGISVGCLLIVPTDWPKFNKVMSGVKNFKLQLIRTQSKISQINGVNGAVGGSKYLNTTIKRN
jgi:hypothetical protein